MKGVLANMASEKLWSREKACRRLRELKEGVFKTLQHRRRECIAQDILSGKICIKSPAEIRIVLAECRTEDINGRAPIMSAVPVSELLVNPEEWDEKDVVDEQVAQCIEQKFQECLDAATFRENLSGDNLFEIIEQFNSFLADMVTEHSLEKEE